MVCVAENLLLEYFERYIWWRHQGTKSIDLTKSSIIR
jgi:hypothetical protein